MHNLYNKKILILGLGITGLNTLNSLSLYNQNIVIVDDNKSDEEIESNEMKFKVYTTKEFQQEKLKIDIIIKSPGIDFSHEIIKNTSIPIINDIELAYEIAKDRNIKIIGITGTNGKTSSTQFIANLLNENNKKAFSCGNIGISPLYILDTEENIDYLVMELSSFQLKNIHNFRCDDAFFLNFSNDHMDVHKTLDDYYDSKMNIIKNAPTSNCIYVNEDLEESIKNIKVCTNNHLIPTKLIEDAYGINVENLKLIYHYAKNNNISDEVFKKTIIKFKPLEHRLEYLGEINGVKYINDSKATNVEATKLAINQFKNIHLLVGGFDKGEDLSTFALNNPNIKKIYAFGENKKQFENYQNVSLLNDLKEVFEEINKYTESGDVVILSPASASYDQFKNYQERGNFFKELFMSLKGE